MASTYPIFDWWDERITTYQQFIKFPEEFKKQSIPKNYENIISGFMKSKNIRAKKLVFENIEHNIEKVIATHKYIINFTQEQESKLDKYFEASEKLYNVCIDVWKKYKEMTTCWQIVKDVIFDHYYRYNNGISYDLIIENIIKELKQKRELYDIETEKNQKIINEIKGKNKEKHMKILEQWNKDKKDAKSKGFKFITKRPKMEKVKIEKITQPKKNRSIFIKPAPDDTLKAVIVEFCKDLKVNNDKKYEDKNFVFEMKYKDTTKKRHLHVGERAITKNGLFIREFGESKCNNYKMIYEKYKDNLCQSIIIYDRLFNKYYFYVVHKMDKIIINDREKVVALDPGEKIFQNFYALKETGKFGENMRDKIRPLMRKISKIQKLSSESKIKTQKIKYTKIINRYYRRIKGYVNEIHKKTANYLCKNYENILIPIFKTKPLISNKKAQNERARIGKITDEEQKKEENKKFNKSLQMSDEVKFVLSMQSHYRFKEYLKSCAKKYRTNVYEIDESFTSQACTKCGNLSKEYDNKRVKQCKCGYKIDRDMNGSRNILLKNIKIVASIRNRPTGREEPQLLENDEFCI